MHVAVWLGRNRLLSGLLHSSGIWCRVIDKGQRGPWAQARQHMLQCSALLVMLSFLSGWTPNGPDQRRQISPPQAGTAARDLSCVPGPFPFTVRFQCVLGCTDGQSPSCKVL